MIIYNETKTQILQNEQCDLTQGFLFEESLLIGDKLEKILVYKRYTETELREFQILTLETWFETTYKETFEKCTRKLALGLKMRDGSEPSIVLNNLYLEAEHKANLINSLRNQH